ncbi:unnamed protein product [Blepharisma stoltei]|uniref:Importin N-terminal domain-containing protein n=1 Tax=Blepharisma stoltei TaxID=1481888 RepID=A0AAU9I8A2_9CILI|nr:unnamed protein product [Blepharisma stoltei]
MEESIIIEAFRVSLQPDNEARKQAQTLLASFQTSPGLIPTLMKIALSEHPIEIKQLAVIFLKNLTKIWKDSKREFALPPNDKIFLRTNIIECLRFSIPEKIRSQFEEIAHNIAKVDFPWEEILVQVDAALNSDVDHIYAALTMIYQIAKVYEFAMDEKRKNLKLLIDRCFGKLDQLLGTFLGEGNADAFRYMALVLQIFWVSFYIELPQSQTSTQQLDSWLTKFKTILLIDLGNLETPITNDDEKKLRDSNPHWACKKWAAQIVHRFFNRYFNLAYLKDHNQIIGQHFQSQWALPLFAVVLPLLYKRASCYIPDIVTNYLLKYVSQGIKFENVAEQMKTAAAPNGKLAIPALITDIIIPIIYRNPSDEELWQENPIEFVRKESDLGRAYYSAKSSAIDLLIVICEKGYLPTFLDYVSTELQSSPQLLHKEAILLALGSIYQILKENVELAQNIQNILSVYVLPEFENPVGFLRARACWMYAQFASFPFTNAEHQGLALQKICQMMLDPDLPVRTEAATALPRLLLWNISKDKVSSEIKEILQVYLKLMSEIDSEDVVDALEEIVGRFSTEIIPYALEFTQHLIATFFRMSSNEGAQDEGESAMAAVSILNTIAKLVDSFEERPQDLLNMSYLLVPVFDYCLNEKGCEFFEEAVHLLTSLLYYAPKDFLPHLFPFTRCLRASLLGEGNVKAYALEHTLEVFSPIANFIAKYLQLTTENLGIILSMGLDLLKGEAPEDPDLITGCKILIALLENLKGPLDQFIPEIVKQVSTLFKLKVKKKVKVHAAEVICISLWNNPIVTLQALQELGVLTEVFRGCFENPEQYNDYLPRNYAILGLSSLVSICENLPPVLSEGMPFALKTLLKLWNDLDEGDEEEGGEGGENGPAVMIESTKFDAEYQKLLEKLKNAKDMEEEDDDEDDPFDGTPEDLYDSPFENFGLKEYLKNILVNFSQRCPDIHSKAYAGLTEEEISALNEINS